MNVTTQVRRSSIASTLAAAALVMAACTTDESIPEASPSNGEGSIELSVTPDPVMLNDSGTTEYTTEWTAEADGDGNCEFVLTVSDPREQVIHSVPVSGCESSMAMTLVDGAGELDAGEYLVELKRDNERAEATFTLEK
ncbi:hypothetical protein [Corynebacterium xerosis]|uniref:Proteinase inhibitor I42 chagasin domain-containing protein n=1 Tax=Corynebacterium xerosis TaxID=1725 RepID=A0ABV3UU46_9CORY